MNWGSVLGKLAWTIELICALSLWISSIACLLSTQRKRMIAKTAHLRPNKVVRAEFQATTRVFISADDRENLE